MILSQNALFNSWLEKIQNAPQESFLLPELINWINDYNLQFHVSLTWQDFEFWLNHFSHLNFEEERKIRGKLIGKYLPREEFQLFFPVGMGKIFPGSHFIAAHLSPDLDTTVASLITWMEAIGCKVCEKQHIWNLPGGLTDFTAQKLFSRVLGENFSELTIRKEIALSLASKDLMTKEGFLTFKENTPITELEHGYQHQAIVLIDEKGKFKGDWRLQDIESTGQITLLFKSLLKSFETDFILFYLKKLSHPQDKLTTDEIWQKPFDLSNFSEGQKNLLDLFLKEILQISSGLKGNFEAIFNSLGLTKLELNISNEPFKELEELVLSLDREIRKARKWSDELGVVLAIKEKIQLKEPHLINLGTDYEEIAYQMKNYDSLTVVDASKAPIGIVRAKDLRDRPLGVVSFCDFSNFEEVKMPSYLSVISVMDHHKSSYSTYCPGAVTVSDVQSCNILVAEALLAMSDKYSFGRKKPYFIHPEREKADLRLCLLAILDDTDFLTKVTLRDVICLSKILAKLESLINQKVIEPETFDSINHLDDFSSLAAKKLLENPILKSMAKEVMSLKKDELELSISNFTKGLPHHLFNDTKEQNGCALITQIKKLNGQGAASSMFFNEAKDQLIQAWIQFAKETNEKKPEIDLCILMLSSVTYDVNDVDQLVFWIPATDKGKSHLSLFLHSFYPSIKGDEVLKTHLELINDTNHILREVFSRINASAINKADERDVSGTDKVWAVLNYPAGKMNSRKLKISPFLPQG